MKVSSFASSLSLLLFSFGTKAQYTLSTEYSGATFFDNFNFFTATDPNNGFVDYQTKAQAQSAGLIKTKANGAAYIGVDSTTKYSSTAPGRPSVRIQSKATFTRGLLIADIAHMPARICGTWPAFWTLGDGTWPTNGEIDIIEGVSKQTVNQMVLHTQKSCVTDGTGQTGTQLITNCTVEYSTSGCQVQGDTSGYGDTFNSNGGGVYAMEWLTTGIKFWFFPRGSIPASIKNGAPDVSTFGTPVANYAGSGCNWKDSFKNQRIVFNINFCGEWAGAVYDTSVCPSTPGASAWASCVDHVAAHPASFAKAYWEVNSVKVYKKAAASSRVRRDISGEEFAQEVY